MYLIHATRCDDPAAPKQRRELWRRVRRFNLPVQLAVTAGEDAATAAQDPSTAALISLAPCNSGSPELFDAILSVGANGHGGQLHTPRINPTLTFHAVDNLALSSLAIALGNHAYGLGLGGAAGQAWVALEIARDRLAAGHEEEVLVVAGDQPDAAAGDVGLAVALLFSRHPAPYPPFDTPLRLAAIERSPLPEPPTLVERDAAAGLSTLIERLSTSSEWNGNGDDSLVYSVPAELSDGLDQVELHWDTSRQATTTTGADT